MTPPAPPPDAAQPITLRAADVEVDVDAAAGGRLARLAVGGLDVLLQERDREPVEPAAVTWGSYPMLPWAGRQGFGRFTFAGVAHTLPVNLGPHAIHGVAFDRPWRILERDATSVVLDLELDERWPFAARASQTITLAPDALRCALRLEARQAMPAVVGWHPWFRRTLVAADGRTSPPVELDLRAGAVLERGEDGLPTGRRVPVPAPPWDDVFVDVTSPPRLRWPGWLTLTLESSLDHWVVFTERPHALCVEPQSGPPDSLDRAPVVEPGGPLEAWMRFAWTLESRGAG